MTERPDVRATSLREEDAFLEAFDAAYNSLLPALPVSLSDTDQDTEDGGSARSPIDVQVLEAGKAWLLLNVLSPAECDHLMQVLASFGVTFRPFSSFYSLSYALPSPIKGV